MAFRQSQKSHRSRQSTSTKSPSNQRSIEDFFPKSDERKPHVSLKETSRKPFSLRNGQETTSTPRALNRNRNSLSSKPSTVEVPIVTLSDSDSESSAKETKSNNSENGNFVEVRPPQVKTRRVSRQLDHEVDNSKFKIVELPLDIENVIRGRKRRNTCSEIENNKSEMPSNIESTTFCDFNDYYKENIDPEKAKAETTLRASENFVPSPPSSVSPRASSNASEVVTDPPSINQNCDRPSTSRESSIWTSRVTASRASSKEKESKEPKPRRKSLASEPEPRRLRASRLSAEIAKELIGSQCVTSRPPPIPKEKVKVIKENTKKKKIPVSRPLPAPPDDSIAIVPVAKVKNTENLLPDSYCEEEYAVHRIMQKYSNPKGDAYLVYWQNWPINTCSLQTASDLENSAKLMEEFEIKEKGLECLTAKLIKDVKMGRFADLDIRKSIRRTEPYFTRRLLEPCCPNIDETRFKEFHKIWEQGGSIPPLGYWNLKYLEIEWLKLLDPNADGDGVAPLYIEHWYGKKFDPPRFRFILENEITESAKAAFREHAEIGGDSGKKCECTCECFGLCADCKNGFDSDGKRYVFIDGLLRPANKEENGAYHYAFGCSKRQCKCPEGCPNSIVEQGRRVPLVVFYEPLIGGYGVRSLVNIKAGTFISDYIGAVYATGEEDEDHGTSYLFDLGSSDLTIDAFECGNESRFFSHSCEPNMICVRIFSEGFQNFYHKLCLFANRDIEAGEELTFDYHPQGSQKRPKELSVRACKCKTDSCRGWV